MRIAGERKTYVGLAAVCAAYFLIFSAFTAVEALQSSLYKTKGAFAMTALYVTITSTSLFLPKLAMEFVKKNRLLGLSVIPYILLTLANLYPRPHTLISTAILVGCSASVLWTTTRVYIHDLAAQHAQITGVDKDKTTMRFFGFFFISPAMGLLVGNGVSSIVTDHFSNNEKTNNAKSFATSMDTINVMSKNTSYSLCGIYNCNGRKYESCDSSGYRYQDGVNGYMDKTTLYVLLGGFAMAQFIAALIMCCIEIEESNPSSENINNSTIHLIQRGESNASENEGYEISATVLQRAKKNVAAVLKFYIDQPIAVLLAPYTIHLGILEGFVMSQVTRDWITCNLGITSVGYGIAAYGVGSIIGSNGFAILSRYVAMWTIVFADLLMEIASIAMLWHHEQHNTAWLLYLTMGVLGIVSQSLRAANAVIPSIYFPNHTEAALATILTWSSVGKATAFGISHSICNLAYLILMISVSFTAAILYFLSKIIHAKRH